MTAGNERPTWKVEISPTTDPLETPVWDDETAFVKGIETALGRQQALDAFQPGTAEITVDNSGRRFDPNHATGPHYGDLLPARRARIRAGYGPDSLSLDGAGDYASSPDPDDATLGFVTGTEGDNSIRFDHANNTFDTSAATTSVKWFVLCRCNDWTPSTTLGGFVRTNGGEVALTLNTGGKITSTIDYTTGTGSKTSTDVLQTEASLADGDAVWIRVEVDLVAGSTSWWWSRQTDRTNYADVDDWTPFSTTAESSAPMSPYTIKPDEKLQVGRDWNGEVYAAALLLDDVVAGHCNFSEDAAHGDTSFTGSDGASWVAISTATVEKAVGSLTVRALVAPDDWTPTADETVIAHANATPSWAAMIDTTGGAQLEVTVGGSTDTAVSSASLGGTDTEPLWVEWARDWGSGDVTFRTSADVELDHDAASFAAVGATQATTAGPLDRSADLWEIGANGGGTADELAGLVKAIAVLADTSTDGTSSVIAAPEFGDIAQFQSGASSGTDPQGNEWTLAGGASLPLRVYDVFSGFVDGWPVPSRTLGKATVGATDGFSLLNSSRGPSGSALDYAMLGVSPVHYWKLDDPEQSETVADRGSRALDGIVRGGAQDGLGATGLDPGSDATALAFTGDDTGGYIDVTGSRSNVFKAISFLIRPGSAAANGVIWWDPYIGYAVRLTGGKVQAVYATNDETTTLVLDADTTYSVIVTASGSSLDIYVDGVAQATTSGSGEVVLGRTTLVGDSSALDEALDATLSHVATFATTALTAEEIASIGLSGADQLSGETIDERIDRLLDLALWPTADRDLDGSAQGELGPWTPEANTLDDLRTLEETEGGAFYQGPDGTIRFRNRHSRATASRSQNVRYTFTDEPGNDLYRFSGLTIDDSLEWIRNRIVVSYAAGDTSGQIVVEDPDSIDTYGIREHSVSTVFPTAAQARSLGDWILARYAEPVTRISELRLDAAPEPRLWLPILDLEIGDRVRVEWTPGGIGSSIVVDALVEGKRIRAGEGVEVGEAFLSLSQAETLDLWIWDESLWDTGTIWG